jgi:hypothetical protein
VGSLQDHDVGATDPRWHCTRVGEIETLVKAGYWALKTYDWLAGIP